MQPPLLSLMLFMPLLGVVIIWLTKASIARWTALVISSMTLLVSILVIVNFDVSNPGFQLIEKHSWVASLNIHYQIGVDGISLLFLTLTIVVFQAMILGSWKSIHLIPKLYYSLLLLLLMSILGIFVALDTILFFLFWELTLIPIYFLTSIWGVGPNRRYAASKYTFIMLAGGIPLLFGYLLLAFPDQNDQVFHFDYLYLINHPIEAKEQLLIFFLLFTAFAIKTPLFPFHTWLPVAAMEGAISTGVVLTSIKLGIYGLLRFVIPLAPQAAVQMHWVLVSMGVITLGYGTMMALHQTNLRRLLAFAAIAHAGMIVAALASFNIEGFQGAILQMLNLVYISSALFILVGYLHFRIGTNELISLGGIATCMPVLTGLFFIFSMALIGIPGTSGFPAEFLMILSILKTHTGAGLLVLGSVVFTAVYMFVSYRKAFLGPITNQSIVQSLDLLPRELLFILGFLVITLLLGFVPSLVLDIVTPAAESILQRLDVK